MGKKKIMKWVNMIAFGLLLVGGINFLLMGLFQFDLYAAIFGGRDAVVSRIFYSLFGIAAVTLLATILWKALMTGQQNKANKTTKSTGAAKTA